LGAAAVGRLAQGERGVMVGLVEGALVTTPLSEAAERSRELSAEHWEMASVLAR
jgi:6-phosphofructokinase 1